MKWKHVVESEEEDGLRFFRGFLWGCSISFALFAGVAAVAMLLAKC